MAQPTRRSASARELRSLKPSQEWLDAAKRDEPDTTFIKMTLDLIEEGVLEWFMYDGAACLRFPHRRKARERLYN